MFTSYLVTTITIINLLLGIISKKKQLYKLLISNTQFKFVKN